MRLGSNFRRVVRWGRNYLALQAVLVLSLQGVTEVRESQMAIELQALPLEKFAIEIFLPLYTSLPVLCKLAGQCGVLC